MALLPVIQSYFLWHFTPNTASDIWWCFWVALWEILMHWYGQDKRGNQNYFYFLVLLWDSLSIGIIIYLIPMPFFIWVGIVSIFLFFLHSLPFGKSVNIQTITFKNYYYYGVKKGFFNNLNNRNWSKNK